MDTAELLSELEARPWFTFDTARQLGLSKGSIYRLRDTGSIEVLARGLYQWAGAGTADPTLLAAAALRPESTLCLSSALARHGLTDDIPRRYDIALPRGMRRPTIDGPIQWHAFEAATFEIGRMEANLDSGISIGIYSAERCIIDAFRLRGREGHETANEALKRWIAAPGTQPAQLLSMARQLPRTDRPLRTALEILL
jgi:predicted transcriptional regulator of viral defense system